MVLVWQDIRLVFLLFCSLWHTAAADCLPEPIDIRLGNVTLPNYDNKVIRGLDITLGTPAQQFAFLPQTPLNNSFVYWSDKGLCGSSRSTNSCAVFRGGLYDNTSSSSIGTAAVNSHPAKGAGYPVCQWVTDDMTLGSNTSIQDYPFGIAQKDWNEQGYHPQSSLGVGSNSSVLSSLKNAGKIASRSWSMFWGLQGATENAQMDGSFVMGGYDKAKTKGQEYKNQLSYSNTNCATGMLLTITGMDLNYPNGTTKSMFGTADSSALLACIDPDYPVLMSIPYSPYYAKYEEVTKTFTQKRSFGVNYYGMLYEGTSNKLFDGDLTVTFGSTFSVRIRNDQLIVPDLTIDNQSGDLQVNGSTPELIFNSLQSANQGDMARIGRQFFSGAYLMVNHDSSEYTMWAANATTDKNLVIVDEKGNERPSPCSSSTPVGSSTPSGESGGSGGSKSISSGGIAGAVVGSVAGVALIASAVFFFIWRRRKAAMTEAAAAENQRSSMGEAGAGTFRSSASDKGPIDLTPRMAQELAGDNHNPSHELPTDTARQELHGGEYFQHPHELPSRPVVAPAELE